MAGSAFEKLDAGERDLALASLLDIHQTVAALRATSFHIAPEILSAMLGGLPQR